MKILNRLLELKDKKHAEFNSKLLPNIQKETIIGVRVPDIRKLAKEYIKNEEFELFLEDLPHKYYDENLLHSMLVSEIKDYDQCVKELDKFLPYVNNWAVCDTISPKIFKNNKQKLIENIKIWILSKETYVCRFGILMLMKHFLDNNFKPEYLEIPANVHSNEYYVKMMISWFFRLRCQSIGKKLLFILNKKN